MKYLFSGLAASSIALLSFSVLTHADEVAKAEDAQQTMSLADALIPVLIMVTVSLVARPFFKKRRQARIDRQETEDK